MIRRHYILNKTYTADILWGVILVLSAIMSVEYALLYPQDTEAPALIWASVCFISMGALVFYNAYMVKHNK